MSNKKRPMTAAEKKRRQRERDKKLGWVCVQVRVAAEHSEAVREFAKSLPGPGIKEADDDDDTPDLFAQNEIHQSCGQRSLHAGL